MRIPIALAALCLLLSASAVTVQAQAKIGWVNSAAIMEKLPEAQDAQHQIDKLVADWQDELAKMQNDWQKRYEEYDKKKSDILSAM